MSAKGRGRHEGGAEDYYPTPAWCVDRLLDRIGDRLLDSLEDGDALEPTVGDGAIVRAAQAWVLRTYRSDARIRWTGVELRRGALAPGTVLHRHVEGVDFRTFENALVWTEGQPYALALGNPSYVIAEDIIRRALSMSVTVAMLLRTGFLGSDERVEFWRGVGANPGLYVLPDRPSFDGVGTDAATYAWFVWSDDERFRGVHMLDSTPLAVRNAQKPQGLAFAALQGSLPLGDP